MRRWDWRSNLERERWGVRAVAATSRARWALEPPAPALGRCTEGQRSGSRGAMKASRRSLVKRRRAACRSLVDGRRKGGLAKDMLLARLSPRKSSDPLEPLRRVALTLSFRPVICLFLSA